MGDESEQNGLSDGRDSVAQGHEQLHASLNAALERHHRALSAELLDILGGRPRMLPKEQNMLESRGSEASNDDTEMADALHDATPVCANDRPSLHGGSSEVERPGQSLADPDPSRADRSEAEDDSVDSVVTRSAGVVGVNATMSTTRTWLSQSRSSIVFGAQDAMNLSKNPLASLSAAALCISGRREFELVVASVIVTNSIVIGFATDWAVKHPGEDHPRSFRVFDWVFLVLFSIELLIRMLAEGWSFLSWSNRQLSWNVFDSILVLVTSLNELNPFNLNLSVVRVFRVLRLVHAVRVIRLMKSFRELRLMVTGIMSCGKTLLWSILLLFGITYIYAVLCLQVSAEWLASVGVEPVISQAQRDTVAFLESRFPSMEETVYTLFKALSGGISWGEVSDPLRGVSIWLLLSFPFYIVVTVFCVLNIITAAFVEAAARSTSDEESDALEHIYARQQWIEQITMLFEKHHVDGQGGLNFKNFQKLAGDWRTQAYFRRIGLDIDHQSLKSIFYLFDWNDDGRIDLNEFAQGVHHLRGPARSLDMYRHFKVLNNKLEAMSTRVRRIRSSGSRDTSFSGRGNGLDVLRQ